MSSPELIVILLMCGVIWYLLVGMRAKELARRAGKLACENMDVLFLDDTVVLEKIRIRRSPTGSLAFFRVYNFEFTSDGGERYKGSISMLGRKTQKLDMPPYRIH